MPALPTVPSNSDQLIQLFKKNSAEYIRRLPKKTRVALKDWTGNAHILVNWRLSGLSFEQMRQKDDERVDYEFNVYRNPFEDRTVKSYSLRSASRPYWSKTSFWKSFTHDQQTVLTTWMDEWPVTSKEQQSAFEKRWPILRRLFGTAYVNRIATDTNVIEDDEDGNLLSRPITEVRTNAINAEMFLLDYFTTQTPENPGLFNVFTFSQMDAIIEAATQEFARIFSNGLAIDRPMVLYRGLADKYKAKVQFRATSANKRSVVFFAPTTLERGSLVLFYVPAGTKLFMLTGDVAFDSEDEVVLPWNTRLRKVADPQPMVFYNEQEMRAWGVRNNSVVYTAQYLVG